MITLQAFCDTVEYLKNRNTFPIMYAMLASSDHILLHRSFGDKARYAFCYDSIIFYYGGSRYNEILFQFDDETFEYIEILTNKERIIKEIIE